MVYNNKNNLFIFSGNRWESIYLNLSNGIYNLKKNLKNSLRRDIIRKNRSKKFNLRRILSEKEFSEFVQNYTAQKKEKKFKGISKDILKKLFKNNNLLIVNAFFKNKIVSSVCIALHGSTATYLVGLNFDKTNSANDLLLWKSIIFLKKNKFKYFDLGGIDFISNRNVSIFKSNFGGSHYKLAGSKFLII